MIHDNADARNHDTPPRDDVPIQDGVVLRICRGLTCGPHSAALDGALRELIAAQNLGGRVGVCYETCFGRCFAGPNIRVERWRDGHPPSKEAELALMMRGSHADLRFEEHVRVEDLGGILRRVVRDLEKNSPSA